MATGRQQHHAPEAEASDTPVTAQERMAATVRTPDGKAVDARRKVIVEPVCGQIKEVRGFRRFLLRGLEKIRGAWRLVCLTQNLLQLWRYGCAPLAASPGEVAALCVRNGPCGATLIGVRRLFRCKVHATSDVTTNRTAKHDPKRRWRLILGQPPRSNVTPERSVLPPRQRQGNTAHRHQ